MLHADDPAVVSNLMKHVDRSQTGMISEDEFVAFFRNLRMQDLQDKVLWGVGSWGR